jgi:hypothetical protein
MVRLMLAVMPLLCVAGAASSAPARESTCVEIRLLPDGRELRSVRQVQNGSGKQRAMSTSHSAAYGSSSSAGVRSRSGSGRTSVSSSSSASSSSTGGRRTARATASYTDEEGRTVTSTHDERGCTIVIDERETQGE